jgi:hypothetical protein
VKMTLVEISDDGNRWELSEGDQERDERRRTHASYRSEASLAPAAAVAPRSDVDSRMSALEAQLSALVTSIDAMAERVNVTKAAAGDLLVLRSEVQALLADLSDASETFMVASQPVFDEIDKVRHRAHLRLERMEGLVRLEEEVRSRYAMEARLQQRWRNYLALGALAPAFIYVALLLDVASAATRSAFYSAPFFLLMLAVAAPFIVFAGVLVLLALKRDAALLGARQRMLSLLDQRYARLLQSGDDLG